MTQLHQVEQHAGDPGRAVSFYTPVLGGEAMARSAPPGLAFIAFDGVRLLLEQAAPPALIYLRGREVRKAIDEMRDSGVTIDTEPHKIHVDADGAFGEPG